VRSNARAVKQMVLRVEDLSFSLQVEYGGMGLRQSGDGGSGGNIIQSWVITGLTSLQTVSSHRG
jgi:hypothetical protein